MVIRQRILTLQCELGYFRDFIVSALPHYEVRCYRVRLNFFFWVIVCLIDICGFFFIIIIRDFC